MARVVCLSPFAHPGWFVGDSWLLAKKDFVNFQLNFFVCDTGLVQVDQLAILAGVTQQQHRQLHSDMSQKFLFTPRYSCPIFLRAFNLEDLYFPCKCLRLFIYCYFYCSFAIIACFD